MCVAAGSAEGTMGDGALKLKTINEKITSKINAGIQESSNIFHLLSNANWINRECFKNTHVDFS